MKIILIAAVADNGVIGLQGRIPWHIGEDLQRFKALTLGHTILMGRRTYQSLGRPLPGRRNVVLSRQGFTATGISTSPSLAAALQECRQRHESAIFVIGGAALYREALPLAEVLHLTHVQQQPPGDTFFPEVDWEAWQLVAQQQRNGYRFAEYHRRPAASVLKSGP